MNKKQERQKEIINRVAKVFTATLTAITYLFLLFTSGFMIFTNSIAVTKLQTQPLVYVLLLGNFIIFGLLFKAYFEYFDTLE